MAIPRGYENNTIEVRVGDDLKPQRRKFNKVPNGQGVARGYWTVKRVEDLTIPGDLTAVWQKVITSEAQVNVGVIEDSGAVGGKATLVWEGSYLDSLLLTPGVEYVYDMEIISTAGKNFTMESGTLVALAQVTQS